MKNDRVLQFGVGIALFLAIGVIKLTLDFHRSESEVESSKTDWPEDFRSSLVSECAESFAKEMAAEPSPFRRPAEEIRNDDRVLSYCRCMIGEVEKARVVAARFNRLKDTQESYAERVSLEMTRFFGSEQGGASISGCLDQAGLKRS